MTELTGLKYFDLVQFNFGDNSAQVRLYNNIDSVWSVQIQPYQTLTCHPYLTSWKPIRASLVITRIKLIP